MLRSKQKLLKKFAESTEPSKRDWALRRILKTFTSRNILSLPLSDFFTILSFAIIKKSKMIPSLQQVRIKVLPYFLDPNEAPQVKENFAEIETLYRNAGIPDKG